MKDIISTENIQKKIYTVRGQQVMLDESEMEILKSQIVTSSENHLRSQTVILKKGRGQHRKYLPYAFTEQGVAMLSAVLRSEVGCFFEI